MLLESVQPLSRWWVTWKYPVMLVTAGVGMVGFSVSHLVNCRTAETAVPTWAVTKGTLTTWKSKPHLGSGEYRQLFVTYQYAVDGREYTGARFSLATQVVSKQMHDDLQAKWWRCGVTLDIAYDPNNPRDSCIKETAAYASADRTDSWVCGGAGLLFLAAGGYRSIRVANVSGAASYRGSS